MTKKLEAYSYLHEYQKKAMDFIVKRKRCALWFDMGLGKSLITLSALNEISPKNHVLIVAPLNIARSTWIDEIEKWGFPYRYKSLIVDEKGKKLTKEKRLQLYENLKNELPSIYFINRDLIVDLVKWTLQSKDKIWYFPVVILDESQSFKSYKSQRFLALKQILSATTHLIELTGTPQPQGIEDLWSQIYMLDGGARLGKNITRFRDTFCIGAAYVDNFPTKYLPKPGAEREIQRRIKDIVISAKNNLIKLPDLIINQIAVHMDAKEMKTYKKMLKNYVLQIGEETITAANAGVLQMKLSQMASGAIYKNDSRDYFVIHEKKLEMTAYIIEQTDSPVLIAYHFQSDKEMLVRYLEKNGLSAKIFDGKPETIKAWNNGEIKVLLLQPASAGHGLNLQTGPGHTLIWYTLPSSLEEYLQCNARLYRQGQKQNVIVNILQTKGTVDAKAWENLLRKNNSQEAMLEAVKIAIDELKKGD